MNLLKSISLIAALSALPLISIAYPLQSIEKLNLLAQEYVQHHVELDPDEKIEVRLGDAGNQLKVAECQNPIHINVPPGTSSQQITTLEMTCTGDVSWHVYVPVDMRILTKVVVTKEMIPAKEIINTDHLDYAYRDKNNLYSGYFKDTSEVVGQAPTSTLVAGTVLSKRNIAHPILVTKNQAVSIVAIRGHIMVRAEGIAKANGALNESIQVLNTSSKKIIDAVVVSSSTVEIRS